MVSLIGLIANQRSLKKTVLNEIRTFKSSLLSLKGHVKKIVDHEDPNITETKNLSIHK